MDRLNECARASMFRRGLAGVLAFLLPLVCLPAIAFACLWDRDTLRYEAKGLPGIVEVITGRFEREPPLYYELRLERVTRELAADPTRLDLYDDAGVACDRLHRGDDAIEWMTRKRASLDALPDSQERKDHEYRYHANLGTFLAHGWLRAGADRSDMQDLLDGRDHIARAIEINPDAHFGREKYQLLAMEWIINPPSPDDPDGDIYISNTIFDKFEAFDRPRLHVVRSDTTWHPEAPDALAGLVVMGDAWQSVDIYHALAVALKAHGHTSLALLAILRAQELIASGRGSLNDALRNTDPDLSLAAESFLQQLEAPSPQKFFTRARSAADDWHAKRTAFMMTRLEAGRHPDTDPTFWDGYRETKPPTPSGSSISGDEMLAIKGVAALIALVAVILSPVIVYIVLRMRRTRRARRRALATPA